MINKVFNAMAYGFKKVQEISKEVTSPEFQNAIFEAVKSGALKGVEILSAPINPQLYKQPQIAVVKLHRN